MGSETLGSYTGSLFTGLTMGLFTFSEMGALKHPGPRKQM